jgi:hypothetical protein
MLWCRGKRQTLYCDVGYRERVLFCGVEGRGRHYAVMLRIESRILCCGVKGRGRHYAVMLGIESRYYAVVYVVSPRIGYGLLAAKCILASTGRLQAYSQDFLMVAELFHTVRFYSWLQN